jgi:hypothetical protein
MIFNAQQRMLHDLAETKRKMATGDRMGTVHEVKQEGGEQKIRCVIGVDQDGKELVGPWINTTDHRGATREQQQFKKGQNVRLSGVDADYRQATVTPAAEGDSFPQPDHAEEHGYGDSFQAGKLHTGKWMPEDDEEQKGGAGAGGSGGAGGGAGSGQQQGEKNHRHEVWIAKEDNKPPKHQGKSKVVESSGAEGGGGQQGQQGQQQKPGEQKKEKKKLEAAVMHSVDEKNGFTARVGEDVRVAAHPEGAKTRAGKTYYSAKKDDNAIMHTEKDLYNKAKQNMYYKVDQGNPYINKPWQIKEREKEDEVPNDNQLGNKKSKGGSGK